MPTCVKMETDKVLKVGFGIPKKFRLASFYGKMDRQGRILVFRV